MSMREVVILGSVPITAQKVRYRIKKDGGRFSQKVWTLAVRLYENDISTPAGTPRTGTNSFPGYIQWQYHLKKLLPGGGGDDITDLFAEMLLPPPAPVP